MKALINQFLSGGIMIAFLTITLFFLGFWRKTRDSLFAVFAAAFFVLAIERVLLLVTSGGPDPSGHLNELRPYVYLVRFFAFALIMTAFVLKNRRGRF